MKRKRPSPTACEACLILFDSFQLFGKLSADANIAALEALVSAIENKRTPVVCQQHRQAVGKLLYAERERRKQADRPL